MTSPRKQIKHFHEPGDCHELTFSCYQRKPLLTNPIWNKLLCQSIDQALVRHHFRLIAFVIMPEHLHLFVYPESNECKIDRLLAAIKRPFSYRIKELLIQKNNDLVLELTSKKNSGKSVFHFWQKGPGYDRNLSTKQAVENAINYIHLNPVKRKLSNDSSSWKWSSARWYESDGKVVDPDLPQIHGLPWEFFEVQ
ncbi:REP-associated tyrosine transposase [Gimesia fumaroli]|uniref:Transposase IS200 like protein n=1 Tax=Gimesia fumaroli TaxID=2527976 RepID=A0A518I8N3_9PLAN|nr:transposase [Gimesia fumaroli]QDV49402.1 Transposase IS200 like protein [Gimesia fumaroli]